MQVTILKGLWPFVSHVRRQSTSYRQSYCIHYILLKIIYNKKLELSIVKGDKVRGDSNSALVLQSSRERVIFFCTLSL